MNRSYFTAKNPELESFITSSLCKSEVLRKYLTHYGKQEKLAISGGMHRLLNGYIANFNVDISHFRPNSIGHKAMLSKTRISDDLVFTDKGSRGHVKSRYLIRLGFENYKCTKCGISEWLGKKISLHLDHINGISSDNRLENLRLLCPNCHSQTATYCRKKCAAGDSNPEHSTSKVDSSCQLGYQRIKINLCQKCGVICNSSNKFCSAVCYQTDRKGKEKPNTRKVLRPSKEILEQEILTHSFLALGRKYGVSDNAIRKWCKIYNIPIA